MNIEHNHFIIHNIKINNASVRAAPILLHTHSITRSFRSMQRAGYAHRHAVVCCVVFNMAPKWPGSPATEIMRSLYGNICLRPPPNASELCCTMHTSHIRCHKKIIALFMILLLFPPIFGASQLRVVCVNVCVACSLQSHTVIRIF